MTSSRRRRLGQFVRAAFAVAAIAFLGASLANQWDGVRDELGQLSWWSVVLSLVLVVVGLVFSMLSWRAILADLGSVLPVRAALRVFFVSQLGKYVPGSVWPVLAQMELGRDHRVPRTRMAATGLVAIGFGLAGALLLAAALLPFGAASDDYRWVIATVPVVLVFMHPRVLSPLLNLGLRLLRRAPLEHPLSMRGVATGVGYATLTWVCTGLHVWLVARDLGGSGARLLPLCIGAFAAAWAAGFLVFLAPAGAGVREGALVVALTGALGGPAATALALVSRLVLTAGDLIVAGSALLTHRPAPMPQDG